MNYLFIIITLVFFNYSHADSTCGKYGKISKKNGFCVCDLGYELENSKFAFSSCVKIKKNGFGADCGEGGKVNAEKLCVCDPGYRLSNDKFIGAVCVKDTEKAELGCNGGELSSDGKSITCANGNVFYLNNNNSSSDRSLIQ